MKTIWLTKCHRCFNTNGVITGASPKTGMKSVCNTCGHEWPHYSDYVDEYKAANGGLGPYPQEVHLPLEAIGIDADYPGSEAFKNEILDLIEKSVAYALLDAYDRMEYDVREITLDGGELPLSRIYNNVVAKRDELREEYNRRYGNDV